jgi:hypothetical protein
MLVAVFGGLSPLRGPSATASAESENNKTAWADASAPASTFGVTPSFLFRWRVAARPPVAQQDSTQSRP